MHQRVSRRAVLSSPASKEINVTTKIYSEMLAADRTDDLQILTDGELDRVVGGQGAQCQGAHYKTVTLAMRKSAGSD
jgi:hypothetical protein